MSAEKTWLSTVDYAKHRGCSDSYVRRLRRNGQLVIRDDGMIDRDASDARLARDLHPLQGGDRTAPPAERAAAPDAAAGAAVDPGVIPGISVHEAVRRERLARARLAELELGEAAGDLARRRDVERAVFTMARRAMERLRCMGTRLRTQLAATSDPREVEALIDAEVREICADMQAGASAAIAQSDDAARAAA